MKDDLEEDIFRKTGHLENKQQKKKKKKSKLRRNTMVLYTLKFKITDLMYFTTVRRKSYRVIFAV